MDLKKIIICILLSTAFIYLYLELKSDSKIVLKQGQLDKTGHKIVIQISPPRSLSTVSLRMWQSRGDFSVMNEPFISAFASRNASDRVLTSGWWKKNSPKTLREAYDNIISFSTQQPLFIKELSFSFIDFLREYNDILKNPRVHFVFLLRNPHAAISSYYQGHGKIIDNFSYLAGYQSTYEIWKMVCELAVNPPTLILAEDLYESPSKTAQTLCASIGVPYKESMIKWDDLGNSFQGEEWNELKISELTYKWHEPAIRSTGFHSPTVYHVNDQGIPTFKEVYNDEDRNECIRAYNNNKYYYDLILNEYANLNLRLQ